VVLKKTQKKSGAFGAEIISFKIIIRISDKKYAESLVTPKFAEKLFRESIGISRFVTPAINLLVTYASFTKHFSNQENEGLDHQSSRGHLS